MAEKHNYQAFLVRLWTVTQNSDAVWDMDRAHDLVNHFVTAFLQSELKGDIAATAALAPEDVSFPGVKYQAEGYAATP